MRILIIEDDRKLCDSLKFQLEKEGILTDLCYDGEDGLDYIRQRTHDLILLDRMLPTMDGLTVLEKMRWEGISTPVILVTALGELSDKITGLNQGADDYLVKPFALKELEARIRALLRRGHLQGSNGAGGLWTCADLVFNDEEHWAERRGQRLRLSPTGFRILRELLRVAPGLVRRQDLERLLWGSEPPEGSALRTHIHELRRELDKPFGRALLHTVPHVGYRLSPDASEEDEAPEPGMPGAGSGSSGTKIAGAENT